MPLQLDYYYGGEAEQYNFYRIPKLLFTDSRFKGVSVEAKVLYSLLLDRMALSMRNGWLDGEGRVYIIFTIAEVMGMLDCAEQKANKLLNELDCVKGVGLIERRRRGLGKPNVIYVKNFTDRTQMPSAPPTEPGKNPPGGTGTEPHSAPEPGNVQGRVGMREPQIQDCENRNPGIVKITSQEMRKSQTNNTYLNKTDLSETDLSIHPPEPGTMGAGHPPEGGAGREDGMDGRNQTELFNAYREVIRANIDYDILLERSPHDRDRLDGFVELMAEVCSSHRSTVRINQEDMSTEVVKGRFLKMDSGHMEYVMDCLDRNTTLVGNIRAYTLSVLFNAPVTISQYYASLVSHDMACGRFAGG